MKPGRKSAAEFEVVTPIEESRPAAPEHLSEAAQEVWKMTVNQMPVRWFTRETWPVLEAYCSHVVTSRTLTRGIDRYCSAPEDIDIGVLNKLSIIRDREDRAAIAAARSLRVTKSSQLGAATAYRKARDEQGADARRPWESKT